MSVDLEGILSKGPREKKKGFYTRPEVRRTVERAVWKDEDVLKLIRKIETTPGYPHRKGMEDVDSQFLRLRDAALISTLWSFGKRIGEVLRLKFGDVALDPYEDTLNVTFRIEKKIRTFRICPKCGKKAGKLAEYCPRCGTPLKDVKPVKVRPPPLVVTKSRPLDDPFVTRILRYVDYAKKRANAKPAVFHTYYVFPPLESRLYTRQHYLLSNINWRRHLTKQRGWQIVSGLDPRLSPHAFRVLFIRRLLSEEDEYGEKRFTTFDVSQITDHSSSLMVERYARAVPGASRAEKQFSRLRFGEKPRPKPKPKKKHHLYLGPG